jgi:hypothetical protein
VSERFNAKSDKERPTTKGRRERKSGELGWREQAEVPGEVGLELDLAVDGEHGHALAACQWRGLQLLDVSYGKPE